MTLNTSPLWRLLDATAVALPTIENLAGLRGTAPDGAPAANRKALARLLAHEHRLDPDALQALTELAAADTPVLVCGQQAGLLLGPGYTIHKALALLALRDRVRAATGRPAVAVFWVEANDHDWAEVARIRIPGRPDFRLALPTALEGRSVGRIPFDATLKGPLRGLLSELAADWPADLLHSAQACLDDAATPAAFFCELLRTLTRGSGLIVLDPSRPAVRELAGPFHRLLHARSVPLAEAVARSTPRLVDLGFIPPVSEAARFPWFVEVDGRRQRPSDEMQAVASVAGPADRLSPDVLGRPLLQDWLLGTALSVLGPSEILYNCQIAGAHEALDLQAPMLWPRPRLRWIGREELNTLRALGLDPAAPPVPGQPWPEDWLRGLDGMAEALEAAEELRELGIRSRELATRFSEREDQQDLLPMAERAMAALAQLGERIQGLARKGHKQQLKEIHALTDWLDHPGLPQERRVNSLALLARAGLSRLDQTLWSQLDPAAEGVSWLIHHAGQVHIEQEHTQSGSPDA
ncbi:MAG: bacillithiol biosynthesis BshC [Candidatus Cloacimonetes bacterium]|nr:bacillithiol biosynthesis BshC [Candidatus Cloacimonadota bacterium]